MPKWIVPALGIVALAALCYYCVRHHAIAIPVDLRAKSVVALQAAGLPSTGLDFDGRIAILKGYADSPEISAKAIQTVRDVNGVFDVKANIMPGFKESVESTVLETRLQEVIVGKVVEFATASAVLTPNGKAILDQMVVLLKEYPQKPVEVSGHTDAEGDHRMNVTLSKERAESVRTYLISKGIAAGRLFAVGHGPDNPVADNNTEAGRQTNRRIEFHVKETR
jgi:OmpA-OmpF porin, OOP family